jgi:hypothetical protein
MPIIAGILRADAPSLDPSETRALRHRESWKISHPAFCVFGVDWDWWKWRMKQSHDRTNPLSTKGKLFIIDFELCHICCQFFKRLVRIKLTVQMVGGDLDNLTLLGMIFIVFAQFAFQHQAFHQF